MQSHVRYEHHMYGTFLSKTAEKSLCLHDSGWQRRQFSYLIDMVLRESNICVTNKLTFSQVKKCIWLYIRKRFIYEKKNDIKSEMISDFLSR